MIIGRHKVVKLSHHHHHHHHHHLLPTFSGCGGGNELIDQQVPPHGLELTRLFEITGADGNDEFYGHTGV